MNTGDNHMLNLGSWRSSLLSAPECPTNLAAIAVDHGLNQT